MRRLAPRWISALGALGALLGAAAPAAALDVLEGLAPADFRTPALAREETRALDVPIRIELGAAAPEAAAPGRTSAEGGTTLAEIGVTTVNGDVARRDSPGVDVLGSGQAAVDVRLLASPAVRDTIGSVLGSGGTLADVTDALDAAGQGDIAGAIQDALGDGGVLDQPADQILDLIDDLDHGVLVPVTGGVLGGVGGLLHRP